MPDPIFADPRLVELYDIMNGDWSDVAVYAGIVDELGASTVLDVGCGTGALACTLALQGIEVIGLDPAAASLGVAQRKFGAERVRWIHGGAFRGDGWLVFETRDPSQRVWERWTKEHTYRELDAPGIGRVNTWTELVEVREPLVSFRHVFQFVQDDSELVSDSTVRFRGRDEIADALDDVGFRLRSVRDAPDRPGMEMVFFAQRDPSTTR